MTRQEILQAPCRQVMKNHRGEPRHEAIEVRACEWEDRGCDNQSERFIQRVQQ